MSRTVQLRAVCSAHSPSKLVHSSVSQATTAVTMDIPIVERAKSAAVVGFKHTQSTRNLRQTMTTQNVKPHQYTAGNLRHGNIKTPLREESDNDSANFSGKDSNEIEAIKLEKQAELQLATHEFKQLLMSKKLFKQLNLSTPTQQASQIVSGKLETEQQRKSAAGEDVSCRRTKNILHRKGAPVFSRKFSCGKKATPFRLEVMHLDTASTLCHTRILLMQQYARSTR